MIVYPELLGPERVVKPAVAQSSLQDVGGGAGKHSNAAIRRIMAGLITNTCVESYTMIGLYCATGSKVYVVYMLNRLLGKGQVAAFFAKISTGITYSTLVSPTHHFSSKNQC